MMRQSQTFFLRFLLQTSAQEGFLTMARGEADEPVHVASFYAPLSYLAHVLYM